MFISKVLTRAAASIGLPTVRDKPTTPKGYRAYVVGDVHGRADLLDVLLAKIEADVRGRPNKKNLVIFLGDLIDRGPASAQVVERLRTYKPAFGEAVFVSGNHEEVMLRVLEGDSDLLMDWLKFGGAECIQSYGEDPEALGRLRPRDAIERLRKVVPAEHESFIQSFADSVAFGDYLFVHAGIRPGVDIEEQSPRDLRWIREPFLDHDAQHSSFIVHGHTITEDVDVRSNRLGIDTGAYSTGVLTALGLEGHYRWVLQTKS